MRGALCLAALGISVLELACSRPAPWYVERGNQYTAAGRYADAEIEYRRSIQVAPNSAEGYYRLGILEYQLRRGDDALVALEHAVSLDPKSDRYAAELAKMAIEAYQLVPSRANLYKIAADEAKHLLKEDPSSFDGLRLRGDVLIADRKYSEAEAEFQKANRIKPNDPDLVLALTQTLLAEHDDTGALHLAQGFLAARPDYPPIYDVLARHYMQTGRTEEAEHLRRQEIAALPKYAPARLQLAKLYQGWGREQEMSAVLVKVLADRAAFPSGPALVGDFYAGSGQWGKALVQYRAGLQAAPPTGRAVYQERTERALEALGNRQEALGLVGEMLRANPADTGLRLRRAKLLDESADAKDREAAREELNALAAEHPANAEVRYRRALSYWARGETAAAWGEATESSQLAKNYAPPRLLLAEIALRAHDAPAAMEAAQEVLAVDPDNAAARLERAKAFLENRSYAQAGSELKALADLEPSSEDVELAMARLEAARRNYARAEVLYRRVYRPGSADLEPLEGLIQLSVDQGQPGKAETLLDEELKQHPDSPPVRMLLASVDARESKFDLALDQYRWLEANGPKSAQTYAALGDLYQRLGKTEDAIANYRKASELAPRDAKIWSAMAMLETGQGQPRQAIRALDRELAIEPNNSAAMNNLAFNLAESGEDLDRALSLVETVARKFPSEPGVLDTLGWVYVKRGLDRGAIQILSGLVKKYPKEAAYHYHLGIALLDLRQTNAGKRELLAALSRHPSEELSRKLEESLRQVQ